MHHSNLDSKLLSWIKEGVDETLQEILRVPDEYVESNFNTSSIERCIAPMHRIKGAVEMVGIQGATLLAEELEILALALANEEISQKKEAAEVLATGMLQLPGYLESLYHGQPDIPLILLPLLNDLRAAQDKELLTEGEFFSPNLDITPPIEAYTQCIVKGDLPTVAKKLRPGYLSGLLGFVRGQNLTENLEKLILVVDNLRIACQHDKSKQLWWISLGLLDSLYDQGIEVTVSIKILLRRIDQQIQRIIQQGEQALLDDPPNKIVKNLLYYLGQSQSYNSRVIEIKKLFQIDYPDTELVNQARQSLYGFNSNLIESISKQVNEELANIKVSLDVAMHANAGSTAGLESMLQQFVTVSDALGMLGMNSAKTQASNQIEFLTPTIRSGGSLTDADMMEIASTILQIESSLSDFGSSLEASDSNMNIPPAEFNKLLKIVAEEIIKNLNSVKHSINSLYVDHSQIGALNDVPEDLNRICGAMRILQHETQAELTQALNRYINEQLIHNKSGFNNESFDQLADAIVGLENYYQAFLEQSVAPDLGIVVATQSMTQLGYPPEISIFQTANSHQISEAL